jgi:radical SAM superfamily enzyme YgiQ (UPF0313 family)
MRIGLVSTYELGHQPWHIASPAAALRRAGHVVRALDLSVEPWSQDLVDWADGLAFSVPMHTAMRLALRAAGGVRTVRPTLPVCFYGLYASVAPAATSGVVDEVLAGEYEPMLVAWADRLGGSPSVRPAVASSAAVHLGRTEFGVPCRDVLPPLARYARMAMAGEERVAGYVEASHGCAHHCRHCPVPVVYDGRVRTVAEDVVLSDVEQLVAGGARHLTFGDPDFLNAPPHASRTVAAVHAAFPELTFDCTVKVEHILRWPDVWGRWADAGCLFVVSAFETVDDDVLGYLDKGHTALQASESVRLLRRHGIEIRPSWLPFHPWTTRRALVDLLEFVVAHDLVANVDPVQYTIRLLLPDGSLLLSLPQMAPYLGTYDPERLSWSWASASPALDALQVGLAVLVEQRLADGAPIEQIFDEVATVVGRRPRAVTGLSRGPQPAAARARLTEPWFCCSEPTSAQLATVR